MSSVLSRRDKRLGRGVGNPLLDSESMPNRGRPELDLHRHARSKSCLCWRPRLFTARKHPWPPTVWHAPLDSRCYEDVGKLISNCSRHIYSVHVRTCTQNNYFDYRLVP